MNFEVGEVEDWSLLVFLGSSLLGGLATLADSL